VHRRSSDRATDWPSLLQRWGPRRARQALVLATALYVLIVVAIAALLLSQGLPWERRVRAALISLLALIALWFWLRILRTQWARLRVVSGGATADSEDTGIWGVGGPGMRTPGSTGLTRMLRDRRRTPETEDGDNPS
jgi:protein-S-isoprenylcysteine O-methyltransferase Ste14